MSTITIIIPTYGKSCTNVYCRLMKKVNIKHISILRKSYIVNLLKQHDLRTAQHLCRHKYISSTEKYISTDIEQLKTNILLFHPL